MKKLFATAVFVFLSICLFAQEQGRDFYGGFGKGVNALMSGSRYSYDEFKRFVSSLEPSLAELDTIEFVDQEDVQKLKVLTPKILSNKNSNFSINIFGNDIKISSTDANASAYYEVGSKVCIALKDGNRKVREEHLAQEREKQLRERMAAENKRREEQEKQKYWEQRLSGGVEYKTEYRLDLGIVPDVNIPKYKNFVTLDTSGLYGGVDIERNKEIVVEIIKLSPPSLDGKSKLYSEGIAYLMQDTVANPSKEFLQAYAELVDFSKESIESNRKSKEKAAMQKAQQEAKQKAKEKLYSETYAKVKASLNTKVPPRYMERVRVGYKNGLSTWLLLCQDEIDNSFNSGIITKAKIRASIWELSSSMANVFDAEEDAIKYQLPLYAEVKKWFATDTHNYLIRKHGEDLYTDGITKTTDGDIDMITKKIMAKFHKKLNN